LKHYPREEFERFRATSDIHRSATFVKARNVFLANNRNAHIGSNAFGFSWGAWVLLIIATGLLLGGMRGDKAAKSSSRRRFWNRRRGAAGSPTGSDLGKKRVKEEYA
jgi:hypothetical protein